MMVQSIQHTRDKDYVQGTSQSAQKRESWARVLLRRNWIRLLKAIRVVSAVGPDKIGECLFFSFISPSLSCLCALRIRCDLRKPCGRCAERYCSTEHRRGAFSRPWTSTRAS